MAEQGSRGKFAQQAPANQKLPIGKTPTSDETVRIQLPPIPQIPISVIPRLYYNFEQLRRSSIETGAEQLALCEVEQVSPKVLLCKQVISCPAAAFVLNLRLPENSPEDQLNQFKSELLKYLELRTPSQEEFQAAKDKFIKYRADRFIAKSDLIKQGFIQNESAEIDLATAGKIADMVLSLPWQLLASPFESVITNFGSAAIIEQKEQRNVIGIHTHPFQTFSPEINKFLTEQNALWCPSKINRALKNPNISKLVETIVENLDQIHEILSNLIVGTEDGARLSQISQTELDEHSVGVVARAKNALKMNDLSDKYHLLSREITLVKNARTALHDFLTSTKEGTELTLDTLEALSNPIPERLSGSFSPSASDVHMSMTLGRGKITADTEMHTEIIINPFGFVVFTGDANWLTCYNFDAQGKHYKTTRKQT